MTLITPSQAGYKASKVDWGSGGGGGSSNVFLPRAKLPENLDFYLRYIVKNQDDEPLPFTKCLLIKPDGSTEVCTTDYEGKLKLIVDDESKNYVLHVITNEVDEAIEPDENDTEVEE
ncbi:hypothetical protein GCM10009129_13620 [Psychrobacter aestuarii]|uniref:Uncharacterized protein n=1 Tax=Psychrobacter aestuarii TaxID=556327 RepID=A0ABP3FI86_9GAMM